MSTIRRNISNFSALDGGIDEYHSQAKMKANRLRGEGETENIFINNGKTLMRPGYQLLGAYFYDKCYGLGEYVDPDGVARLLIAGKSAIYEYGELAYTSRDTGISQERIHFNTHRGRCFYNGLSTQRKLTGTTAARIGVDAPAAAPVLSETGTGLTGDFGFKFTYVIKEGGVKVWESNPSPISSISVTNKTIVVTPSASSDTRVNCRRIYRTSASGVDCMEDGDIDNNTGGATYSSSQADATLGAIVEENHGVPATGFVSEGCNERMFWLVNSGSKARLYWSEQAYTEPYQEYQQSTNYRELPAAGKGVWIKRCYNQNSMKEDLYIAQETGIHVLPQGDPNLPVLTVSRTVGGSQQDNVVEYNNKVYFLSAMKKVYQVSGGKIVDITSRNIPISIDNLYNIENSQAAIIFDHFYCLCSNINVPIEYAQWICDLRTIKEVEEGRADAVWFNWKLPITYILQRQSGSVVAYNETIQRIIHLDFGNTKDEVGDCFFAEALKPVQIAGTFTGLTGSKSIKFDLYSAITGGSSLWSETHTVLIGSDGKWEQEIGIQSAVPADVLSGLAAGTSYYLEITANAEVMTPRRAIPLRAFLNNKITSTTYSMIFTAANITAKFATRFFGAENPSARRIATMIRLTGKQQRKIGVTPVYRDYFDNKGTQSNLERDQGGTVLVDNNTMVWASPSTQIAMNMDENLEPGDGGSVSFRFEKTDEDEYFEVDGLQFHYTEMQRF